MKKAFSVALSVLMLVVPFAAQAGCQGMSVVVHVWQMSALPADIQSRANAIIAQTKTDGRGNRDPGRLSRNLGDELICRSDWDWSARTRLCKPEWLKGRGTYTHAPASIVLNAKLAIFNTDGSSREVSDAQISSVTSLDFENGLNGRVLALYFAGASVLSPVTIDGETGLFLQPSEWGTGVCRKHMHVIVPGGQPKKLIS